MWKVLDKSGKPETIDSNEIYAGAFSRVVKEVDAEKRTLVMVGSDESVDRDGDVLITSGWKLEDYLKNPVFLVGHDRSSLPIAAAKKVVRKRSPWRLEFTLGFPAAGTYPLADLVLELYRQKIMNASSVSFIPYKWEDMTTDELIRRLGSEDLLSPRMWSRRKYTSQALLELSGVSVPANPNAIQASYGSKEFKGKYAETEAEAFDQMASEFDTIVGQIIESEKFNDVIVSKGKLKFDGEVSENALNEIEKIKRQMEYEEETETMVQVPEKIEKVEEPENDKGDGDLIVSVNEIEQIDDNISEELKRLFGQGLIGINFKGAELTTSTEEKLSVESQILGEIQALREELKERDKLFSLVAKTQAKVKRTQADMILSGNADGVASAGKEGKKAAKAANYTKMLEQISVLAEQVEKLSKK